MVNEVKFTLAMDGGTAVVTDLDQVGRKLVDVNTKIRDAGNGADAFGGSMRTVGNQLRGFGGDVDGAKGSVDALAHGLKSAFIGSSVAVGLIGLKNTMMEFTQSMVQAQIQVDQLRNGLNFAVGRSNAAGELNFIRESSKALGLEFVSTSQQYMKLAASARDTSLEGQRVRDVFTAVAQASTVMGLSADQTSGALLAISQMISKNTIMSEELKGQLAERLPGAFQIAARAMGVTTEQLNKMLETGQVVAGDFLPKFARQLSQETAPEVDAASQSMQASVNRLANSWTAFKQAIVENGAGKSIASGMDSLSKSVSGVSEGMKNAKEQGHGFVTQLAELLGGSLAIMIPFVDAPRTFTDSMKEAEAELAVLQKKLVSDPSNAYLKNETYQTYQYVLALREAKKAKDDLNPDYSSPAEDRRFALSADAYREQEKLKKTYAELSQELSGVNPKFQTHLSQLKSAMEAGIITQARYVEDVKALIDKEGGIRKEAVKAQSDVGNTIAANIARANEAALLEIEIGGKVNASDRFRITVLSQISEELRKKNITLERAIALESAMHDAEVNMAKSEAALKAAKDAADTAKDQEKAITALLDAGQKEIDQIDAKIKKQTEVNEQIGLTKEQIFNLNAARQEQAALADEEYAKAIRNAAVYAGEYKDAYLQYANALDLAAEKRRKLAGLDAVGATKKAAEEARKEWEKTADKINDSITEALTRGFENGKPLAENLRDSIAAMFKSMATVKIRAIVEPVGQVMSGVLGFGGSAANAGNTVSGLSNLATIGGAGFQAISGSLTGASAASLGYANAVGAVGGDALGGLIAANGGWAGVSTMATAGEVGALGTAAGAGAGAMGGITSALASIGPVGWAIIAAGAVLALQDHGTPTRGTGEASAYYDRNGRRVDTTSIDQWGGMSTSAGAAIAQMQADYAKTAKTLGVGMVDTQFSYGSNTGKNGQGNNFALGSRAGASGYSTGGEQVYSDAAFSLAASRAVFAALQGSDLPQYLAKVFDGLSAGAMTQDQITNTLAYAQGIKQVRDALLETREPLQILKDNVSQGFATLATSADTFKADFVAAIDAGITPDKLAQWQELQASMKELAATSGKTADTLAAVGRSIADIANERTRLQDRLDELTMTSAQLLEKQRNAIDSSNQALFDQVQAELNAKSAIESLNQAMTDLASANAALESSRRDVASAYKSIQDAAASAAAAVGIAQQNITTGYLAAQEAVANAQANITGLLEQSTTAMRGFANSIDQFLTQMATTDLGSTNKAQQLAALQADFAIASAQARAGDAGALGGLPGKASALLGASKDRLTQLDFAKLSASISSTLDGIAGAVRPGSASASADPAVKAQQDLAHAQGELAKWSNAAAVSGASTAKATTDYLTEWRTATAASAIAQADLLAAQNATHGINTSLPSVIDSLTAAIAGFSMSLSAQLHALSTALAAMRVSGTGGTVAGAGTYTGTQAVQAIKDAYAAGSTTAQIINAANVNLGVSSAEVAKVADVAGYTEISDYQRRIDATAALSATEVTSVVAEATRRAQLNSTTPEAEFVKYLLSIGWNAGMGDKAMGWPNGTTNAWATANGFPAFAAGGDHSGGLRLVGERGIELEATGPSRIWNAQQTRSMLQGGGAEVVAELKALREENARMRAELRAITIHVANTADSTGRMQRNGVLVYTDANEPLSTTGAIYASYPSY